MLMRKKNPSLKKRWDLRLTLEEQEMEHKTETREARLRPRREDSQPPDIQLKTLHPSDDWIWGRGHVKDWYWRKLSTCICQHTWSVAFCSFKPCMHSSEGWREIYIVSGIYFPQQNKCQIPKARELANSSLTTHTTTTPPTVKLDFCGSLCISSYYDPQEYNSFLDCVNNHQNCTDSIVLILK